MSSVHTCSWMNGISCLRVCLQTSFTLVGHEFGHRGGAWMTSGSWDSLSEKLCSTSDLDGLHSTLHHHTAIATSSRLRNTGMQGHRHSVTWSATNRGLTSAPYTAPPPWAAKTGSCCDWIRLKHWQENQTILKKSVRVSRDSYKALTIWRRLWVNIDK